MIDINKMVFGFELEGLYYDPDDDLHIQGYHSGEFGHRTFKMEQDSTLEPDDEDREYDTYEDEYGDEIQDEDGEYTTCWKGAELINRPMTGTSIHSKYVNGVQKYLTNALCRNVKDMKMKNVVYFNDTCGFHVHFSIVDMNLTDTVYYDFIQDLRETFFEKVSNSTIINSNAKRAIKSNYYRSYAREMKVGEFYGQHGQEFNYNSYMAGRGFEWRSPSLNGIKDWDELAEMVRIITSTIVEALNERETTYNEVFACVI